MAGSGIDQGFRKPGDVEIESAVIVTSSGELLDISQITMELNVYQSIFDHYMYCDALIEDSMGILDSLGGGFTGGELLFLSFKNREETNEFEFRKNVFRIYDVTDRNRVQESREIYNFACISAEAYQAAPVKVKKALGGTSGSPVSDMVKSIFNEYIFNGDMKSIHSGISSALKTSLNKKNEFDPTDGNQKFVIPHLDVNDTIDFLCDEADSEDHIPYYLFFENSEGFKFKNLSTLVKQEPIGEWFYLFNNISKEGLAGTTQDDPYKIMAYRVVETSDMLSKLYKGMLKSRTLNLDMMKKKVTEKKYTYDKFYGKFEKLGEGKLAGTLTEETDPVINLITSRTGHDTDKLFSEEKHLPKKINETLGVKEAYSKSIFNTIVEVTLHGNSEFKAGDTINLKFPISTDTDKDKLGDGTDKYLTGKYLITKVRHKITGATTGDTFVSVLECCKDGKSL
jgi:hypothetical protein